jgi:tRNA pseudouridine38-40 synthase
MARYQIILAYDGAQFYGFQRQASHKEQRTVQGVLENALRRLGWQGETLLAAGRTDTGVHAAGQVAACDLNWPHPPDALRSALNAHLPPDVAAREVRLARDDFHPRYHARFRHYRYRLFCHPARDPLHEHFAWRVWPPVDGQRLHRAAAYLTGVHDFAAFGTPPRTGGSTIRNVTQAAWQYDESGLWQFDIIANAFLYHMARRIVGMQAAIAQGMFPEEHMADLLQHPPTQVVQHMAPPQGLTLMHVIYAEDDLVKYEAES